MTKNQLELVGVAGTSAKEVYFKWTVNNVHTLINNSSTIFSPEFQVQLYSDCTKWKIKLDPCAPYESPGCRTVYIYLIEATHPIVDVTVEYKLMNSLGQTLISFNQLSVKMSKGTSFPSISNNSWKDCLHSMSHDNKAILFINLKARLTNHPATLINEPSITNSKLPIFNSESSIVDDFNKLRMDGESSDFTICVQGNEFHAHKIILGARSPVFSSMFKHEMREANSGKLEIEDIEPQVIEEFLNFIYTGNAKIEGMVKELLAAADKYDVKDLKVICEDALIKDLSKENCFNALALGDLYSAKNLKKQAVDFIISNYASLAKEFVEAFMNQKTDH